MKTLKEIIQEDAHDDRMAEQNARKDSENRLLGRLSSYYSTGGEHLTDYTRYSGKVNGHLWNKHKNPETPEDESINEHVAKLDKTLGAYKAPEDMTVWSKSIHDPREHINKDGVMHHPAYFSTSVRKSVVEGQYNNRNVVTDEKGIKHHHLYEVHVSRGTGGVLIPDRTNVDKNAKEYLMPRGINMKYEGTVTKDDGNNMYHTHKMSVI
jgi:hypothetical protein